MVWLDNRARAQVEELKERIAPEEFYRTTGCTDIVYLLTGRFCSTLTPLPEIVEAASVAGRLKAELAGELGLSVPKATSILQSGSVSRFPDFACRSRRRACRR